MDKTYGFEDLRKLVEFFRSEKGTNWLRALTIESLKPFILNETAETVAGINLAAGKEDSTNLCEEVGDLFYLLLLECQIADDEGLFSIDDMIDHVTKKMIYRHPDIIPDETGECHYVDWEVLKAREKAGQSPELLEKIRKAEHEAEKEISLYFAQKNSGKFLDK